MFPNNYFLRYHAVRLVVHTNITSNKKFPTQGSRMRSKFIQLLSLALVVIAMLGAVALPQAAAQDVWPGPGEPTPETGPYGHLRPYYGPPGLGADDYYPAPPTGCEDLPPPTITVEGTNVLIMFPDIWFECTTNVVVGSGASSPFDGPVPATQLLRVPLPVLEQCAGPVTITVTGTTIEGLTPSASLALTADQVTAINNALEAAGQLVADCESVPAEQIPADGVLGAGLAVTGNNIDSPIAAGFALVGVGGLVLLGSRRREQQELDV